MSYLPQNIDSKDLAYFLWMENFNPEPIIIDQIKNGLLVRSSLFEPKKIFPIRDQIYLRALKTVFSGLIKNKYKIFTHNNIALCVNQWSNNYFHWFTEVVPRIIEIKKQNAEILFVFPFVLNSQYQIPSLERLEISYLHGNYHWIFSRRMIFSQNSLENTGHYRASYFNGFRKYFEVSVKNHRKKIYIKRNANKRRILNEDEVIPIFKAFNYTIVETDKLAFQEQLQLFSETSVLASIHGAGLTNMLFMQTPGIVFELSKENEYLDKCYFNLSNVLGHAYYYLFCKPKNLASTYVNADIYVDINKLGSILNEIEKK